MIEHPEQMSGAEVAVSDVLIVDNDTSVLQLLRVHLSAQGYNVATARSGKEALRYMSKRLPDIVLLDILLPDISGLEVLEQVRSRGLDTAIIMTTALGSEQAAVAALRGGANDYLHKPFQLGQLHAVLERVMSQLRFRREQNVLHRQLEADLARAAKIQMELLPRDTLQLPNFELAGRCFPAREVGGDFYDWQATAPNCVTFSLGDIMGKGMPAALLMATAYFSPIRARNLAEGEPGI